MRCRSRKHGRLGDCVWVDGVVDRLPWEGGGGGGRHAALPFSLYLPVSLFIPNSSSHPHLSSTNSYSISSPSPLLHFMGVLFPNPLIGRLVFMGLQMFWRVVFSHPSKGGLFNWLHVSVFLFLAWMLFREVWIVEENRYLSHLRVSHSIPRNFSLFFLLTLLLPPLEWARRIISSRDGKVAYLAHPT